MQYKQDLETFYRKKSILEKKNSKTLKPKSNQKVNPSKIQESYQSLQNQLDNPYKLDDYELKKQYFINENKLLDSLSEKIIELTKKVKQYEYDIMYDLHDDISDYDKYTLELNKLKQRYQQVYNEKKKRKDRLASQLNDHKLQIQELINSYHFSEDIADKKEIYINIHKKQLDYFKKYNRTSIVTQKQRVLIDDENIKNKDEMYIIENRCVIDYEPIVDIELKFSM
jgi:hypothetical protein